MSPAARIIPVHQSKLSWRHLWHPPLSACRSAVSSPEVITHQEGIIPRTAGPASSLGFRSDKPIRQLNRNNDPPLNTLREEHDEEIVEKNPGALADSTNGDADHCELCPLNCSSMQFKISPSREMLGCRHNISSDLYVDSEWKEFGLWGKQTWSELLFCHFHVIRFWQH